MTKAYERLTACYQSIQDRIPFRPKVALVLGSGLGDYADEIWIIMILKDFPYQP